MLAQACACQLPISDTSAHTHVYFQVYRRNHREIQAANHVYRRACAVQCRLKQVLACAP